MKYKKMTIYVFLLAVFTVLVASCGTQVQKPNYPAKVRNKLNISYLTHHGPWQGPDGFPVTGYSLSVLPVRKQELINDYVLKSKWERPWEVFFAVASDKGAIAVKYYKKIDIYSDGKGSNIFSYKGVRRIADLWFAGDSLVVLWNDIEGYYGWNHIADITRVGIDVWDPKTKTTTRTLDIPCENSNPFLSRTAGGTSLLKSACRDNRQLFINDGKTVSLYTIDGKKIQMVHDVKGEIWKCIVKRDKLVVEDRVYGDRGRRLIAHNEKKYDVSKMKRPEKKQR